MLTFKASPDDFQVDERLEMATGLTGEYSIYRLVKRDITTWRALRDILTEFKLTSDRAGIAGLKDKVAVATQTISLRGGPPRHFKTANVELTYLGASSTPVESRASRGNRFVAVLRGATPETATRLATVLPEVSRFGLPNYFDSQRFGSLRGGGDFPVRALLKGDVLGALKLILCSTSRYDPPSRRRQRNHIREHWGDWAACRKHAGDLDDRMLAALQQKPDDPMQAYRLVPHKLRLMFLHAFQSFLWNEILSDALRRSFAPERLVEVHYLGGKLVFPRQPGEDTRAWLAGLALPLPAPGVTATPVWGDAAAAILAREGLTFDALKFPITRDGFFRALPRTALLIPEDAGLLDPAPAPDAVRVQFSLPPGTYATLVLKWLRESVAPAGAPGAASVTAADGDDDAEAPDTDGPDGE